MQRKSSSLNLSRALRLILSTLMIALLIGCGGEPATNNGAPTEPSTPDPKTGEETPGDQTPQDHVNNDPAPEVTAEMTDLAGYQAVIDKHKGKVIVVDFWATWCEPCVERFPHIVELSHQFPADKVAFVSVSLDDPEDQEKVTDFLTQQRAGELTNLHSTLDVADAFEAFDIADGIPNYKLYDVNGEVKYRFALNANPKQNVLVAEELDVKLREMLK